MATRKRSRSSPGETQLPGDEDSRVNPDNSTLKQRKTMVQALKPQSKSKKGGKAKLAMKNNAQTIEVNDSKQNAHGSRTNAVMAPNVNKLMKQAERIVNAT